MNKFQELSPKFKENAKKVAAITALSGAAIWGVQQVNQDHRAIDKIAVDAHNLSELNLYGQKDFEKKYLSLGVKPEDVTLVTINAPVGTAADIAKSLRAKDVTIVAEEIYKQLDGNIREGEVVLLPNDQFNPEPRRLV